MKKTTRMLLMADRSEPRYNGGQRERMPHAGGYPWMPWYGDEPSMNGRERMPKRGGDWDHRRMDDRIDRWDEPRQGGYMGFGDRDGMESRRGRTRTGRYKSSRMGGDEYDDDDDWDDDESEQQKGHGRVMSMPRKLDEHTAHEWMNGLKNEDGTTGPHWTIDQTRQVAKQKGLQYDDLTTWVAMNIMYSDYCGVAKKLNVNNVDFYVCMAQAFLDDKDAAENKLYSYYKHIVK